MMFLMLLLAAAPAEGFKARGFILPDGAVKIDDDRYRLPQPWDEAVKYYRRAYPPSKYPRHNLHSQTPIRAIHIDNPSGVEWDGVHRRWEQVQSYTVDQGYLLIQAADGAEFLLRLCDLGEWQPALDRLDKTIGSRRVGPPTAAR